MDIKIRETGERKPLAIYDRNTGINWVQDLIGNAGAFADGQFVWDEETGEYLADQSTYDWWAQYIADAEQTEADIQTLAEELDMDAADIGLRVQEATGPDYAMHREQAVRAMQEIRDERAAVSAAAATLGRAGGSSTSARKVAAARANGRRGGRPRKQAQ